MASPNPYGTFKSNWKHEVSIRGIKIIDVGFLFASASAFGYISARILSKVFKFNKKHYSKNKVGKFKLAFEILVEMAIIGMTVYATRQIIQAIPFAFDGWKGWSPPKGFLGFRHKKLREWENPYPIAFLILLFQDNLKAKINYFTELNKF
jgi:hypothetical protein